MPLDIEAILRMNEEAAAKEKQSEMAATQEQRIVQISVDELHDFPPELHKFQPATGQRLTDLENSIRINGILNPILIRKLPNGNWQILAGHNRRNAARNIGYRSVPCIIKELPNDDDAVLAMIADNINNRELLPSERGWAYRQELEIRKCQGQRNDLTSSQIGTKLETTGTCGKPYHKFSKSRDGLDDSKCGKSIHRYIRLTYLIQPLLNLVDEGKLALGTGEQLSYLKQRSQETVYLFCYARTKPVTLKESQARSLREIEEDPDQIIDEDVLEELTAPKKKVRLRTVKLEMSKLRDYFPTGTPEEVVVQTIHTALSIYFGKEDPS